MTGLAERNGWNAGEAMSCYFPPANRQSRSNHLSGLACWNLNRFSSILPAFSVYSQQTRKDMHVFCFGIFPRYFHLYEPEEQVLEKEKLKDVFFRL